MVGQFHKDRGLLCPVFETLFLLSVAAAAVAITAGSMADYADGVLATCMAHMPSYAMLPLAAAEEESLTRSAAPPSRLAWGGGQAQLHQLFVWHPVMHPHHHSTFIIMHL